MQRKVNLKQLSKYLNNSSQVVVRVDFNVPIKDGTILDLKRIKSTYFFIEAPSPLCSIWPATILSPLFCFLTSEDLMDR